MNNWKVFLGIALFLMSATFCAQAWKGYSGMNETAECVRSHASWANSDLRWMHEQKVFSKGDVEWFGLRYSEIALLCGEDPATANSDKIPSAVLQYSALPTTVEKAKEEVGKPGAGMRLFP
jgi:hypothetical protein